MDETVYKQVTELAETMWDSWSVLLDGDIEERGASSLKFLEKRRTRELEDLVETRKHTESLDGCVIQPPEYYWEEKHKRIELWYSNAYSEFVRSEEEADQAAAERLINYRKGVLPFIKSDAEYLLHVHGYNAATGDYVAEDAVPALCSGFIKAREATQAVTGNVHREILERIHSGGFSSRRGDQIDFNKKLDRYWGNRLLSEVVREAEREALSAGKSPGRAARLALDKSWKFEIKYVAPAREMFRQIQGWGKLTIEPTQTSFLYPSTTGECVQPDSVQVAAWIIASTRLFPSVKIPMREWGPDWHEKYVEWVLELIKAEDDPTFGKAILLAKTIHGKISKAVRGGQSRKLPEVTCAHIEDIAIQPDPAEQLYALEEVRRRSNEYNERFLRLTDKEQQVYVCSVMGMKRREIAEALGISLETVKTHLKRARKRIAGQRSPSREWRKEQNLPQRRRRAS